MTDSSLRRGTLEFLLIVVGILVAFGLDSWQEERRLRREELSYLEEIREEFAAAIVELDGLVQESQADVEAFGRLQAILSNEAVDPGVDSVGALARRLWFFNPYDPAMPAYRDLLASTGLLGVTNTDLRLAMRRYEEELRANNAAESYMELSTASGWEPTLSTRIPMRRSELPLGISVDRMSEDLEFLNLLNMRRLMADGLTTIRSGLSERSGEVVNLMDLELGRRVVR